MVLRRADPAGRPAAQRVAGPVLSKLLMTGQIKPWRGWPPCAWHYRREQDGTTPGWTTARRLSEYNVQLEMITRRAARGLAGRFGDAVAVREGTNPIDPTKGGEYCWLYPTAWRAGDAVDATGRARRPWRKPTDFGEYWVDEEEITRGDAAKRPGEPAAQPLPPIASYRRQYNEDREPEVETPRGGRAAGGGGCGQVGGRGGEGGEGGGSTRARPRCCASLRSART